MFHQERIPVENAFMAFQALSLQEKHEFIKRYNEFQYKRAHGHRLEFIKGE